jgi:hypothetical protein
MGAFLSPVFPMLCCHESTHAGAAEAKLQCTVKKEGHFHFAVDRN